MCYNKSVRRRRTLKRTPEIIQIYVLETRGYVDRVPDINLFLFGKRASSCDELTAGSDY